MKSSVLQSNQQNNENVAALTDLVNEIFPDSIF